MGFPHGETVTRLRRRPALDPYSGEVTAGDWTGADELPLPGCAVAPVSSTEAPTVDRDTLTTLRTLYAPAGADVLAEDRIRTADGRVWDVKGDPAEWRSPLTGWRPGVVVNLARVEART